MPESASRIIRLSWDAWLASRAAKRAAFEAKGLSASSRRSTARPEARAVAKNILQIGKA